MATYWHGDVPKDVADYAATRPQGVAVVATGGAPYSRSQLQAAARTLMSAPIVRTLKIQAAAARPDGSGLDLTLAGPGPTAAQQAELVRAAGLAAKALTYRSNTPVAPLKAQTQVRQ